jgi:SAM-dependent methyltransferase
MSIAASFHRMRHTLKAESWKRAGRVPGANGFNSARWLAIEKAASGATVGAYGADDAGIDERVVEYAWVFDRMRALARPDARVLDAGSVLNYPSVLGAWRAARLPPVSIVTLEYEGRAEVSSQVRYEFGDLRRLPYRDEWFTAALSLSTLEHVGLDNTIYGSSVASTADPGAEAMRAVEELRRVVVPGGTLLLSVPYGTRSNRGWFRIFDADDLARLTAVQGLGVVASRYFRARREGWRECSAADASDAGYNEPKNRPGQQTAPAWVAAAEAVALVELKKG